LEPLEERGVARGRGWDDFDRDQLSGLPVPALVDRAHPALGDLFDEVVTADSLGGDGIRDFQAHSAASPRAAAAVDGRATRTAIARSVLIHSNSGMGKTH